LEEVRRRSMEEDEPPSPSGTLDGEGFGDADGLMSPGAAKGMNTAQKMSLAALAHTNVNENFRVRIYTPARAPSREPEPRVRAAHHCAYYSRTPPGTVVRGVGSEVRWSRGSRGEGVLV